MSLESPAMTTAATATAIVGAEGEYVRSKTLVLWDIENCEVPRGWDANMIARNVSSALLKMNYCGPVSITAYGDTNLIPRHVQQALSSTGVALHHVPAGVKDASDKKILVDMLLWAVDNPAPANYMLISGDRDFSNALHQLSMRRYTILLAQPPRASAPLVAAAKYVWLWTTLAAGGPPLTSVESSLLLSNGRSNNEVSKQPVSEQGQSSKPTDSSSDPGDSKDCKTYENNAPRGLAQGTKVPQNGRGATDESDNTCRICNVVCDSFEKLMAHTSDQRHISQVALVNSRTANGIVSAKPIQEAADLVEPVWCEVCQFWCTGKDAYKWHKYGKRHRNNLELQSAKSKNILVGPVGSAKEVLEKQKNKMVSDGRGKANADYFCRLCNVTCQSRRVFTSHLRGLKHATMVSQSKALKDAKKLQEKGFGEKDQPRETVVEPQLQSQDAQEKTTEKHVAVGNQSEAHDDSKKFQEKCVGEKYQHGEIIAVPQLQSHDAQKSAVEMHVANEKSVGETDHPRETITEPKPNTEYSCRLCNVKCPSQIVFDSHLRGKKHTANVSQSEALIDSKKLKEKGVSDEKYQPKETVAEPQLQSQSAQMTTKSSEKHVTMVNQSEALSDLRNLQEEGVGEPIAKAQLHAQYAQENNKCYEKHVAMVNQSEALIDHSKFEENCVRGIAEPHSPSPKTREITKIFEKQNQDLSEICGTAESSVKEIFPSTKDRGETVPIGNFVFGRSDFEVPEETREHFDGIVKPVNLSEGASVHLGELKKKQKEDAYVASDNATQSSISTKPIHEPVVLQPVWCQVCQMSCHSVVAYANHTYGKNHRQNLELQSAKNEIMSKGPAKENKEITKVLSKSQTAFDSHLKSQNQCAMVKDHAEALVDSRRTQQACDQEKPRQTLEQELIVDSSKIQEESDQDKTATEEHAHVKIHDLGIRSAQEETEEVKEINTISENLAPVFMAPNQESRIPKETRGFLDVIPEKLEAESKHKPEPKPLEPENESAGRKENQYPGEVPKKEEVKGQVDNFWTFLWGRKT